MSFASLYLKNQRKPQRSIETDLELGLSKEDELLPLLQEHFNDKSIEKSTDKYSSFDFVSSRNGTKFELKSRKVSSAAYGTTMISESKVKSADRSDCECYFIFDFTNCKMYIKYDKNKFAGYKTEYRGRDDRGKSERNLYVMIPTTDLELFC